MRRVTQRKPKVNLTMDKVAESMLQEAQHLFDEAAGLDTAVRDEVSEGLAYIVYAAYDTRACAQCVGSNDFVAFIQTKTYEWFRERGFVEWFCAGASTLFNTTPRQFYRTRVTKAKSGKATIFTRQEVA